ncbi:outer membrane lipid asymmetry maintenance protein MlaD [Thermodesulfobacteriota bacterium]
MKKINVDYVVGLFIIVGFLSFVYISIQLGEFSIFSLEKNYPVVAEFDAISGLKEGAPVEIAGVNIGRVVTIELSEEDRARVTMLIHKQVQITEDAFASVKTMGVIGEKYIKILQGGSEVYLAEGDLIIDTESALDVEELISKYIFGEV